MALSHTALWLLVGAALLEVAAPGRGTVLRCAGVLVAPSFVLMAAQCLDMGPDVMGYDLVQRITVTVGFPLGQQRRVLKVFLHPLWSFEDLSYDLALVHLEGSVDHVAVPTIASQESKYVGAHASEP
eukprot:m51a1_g12405 hypothetical protein (127) ;mRNA; r:696455-697061